MTDGVSLSNAGIVSQAPLSQLEGVLAQISDQVDTVKGFAEAIKIAMESMAQMGDELGDLRDQLKAARGKKAELRTAQSEFAGAGGSAPVVLAKPDKSSDQFYDVGTDSDGNPTKEFNQDRYDTAVSEQEASQVQFDNYHSFDAAIAAQDEVIGKLTQKDIPAKLEGIEKKGKEIAKLFQKKEAAEKDLEKLRDKANDAGVESPDEIVAKEAELQQIEQELVKKQGEFKEMLQGMVGLIDSASAVAGQTVADEALAATQSVVGALAGMGMPIAMPTSGVDNFEENNRAIHSANYVGQGIDLDVG